jgi:ActR/RegA family two-component response regulator
MTDPNSCAMLLVDDDIAWQHINKIVLIKHGFHPDLAYTKDIALGKIHTRKYEIAVVDLRLVDDDQSNFDGIEIIKALQKKNPEVRILVKSGYLSPNIENEVRALKVDGIFDKSTTNKELIDHILKIHQEITHH